MTETILPLLRDTISSAKDQVWGLPLVVLLVGTGLLLTFRLGLVQFRYFAYGVRIALGFVKKEEKIAGNEIEEHPQGEISYFQALATALSATVGTGNIVGVAGAILIGGPGALFWMWVSAFVGMATKYSEAVLAVKYREETRYGFSGGPMYYIANALGWRRISVFFALMTMVAAFGIGNMTQIDAAAGVLQATPLNVPRWLTSLAVATLTALVILGGIRRIGRVAAFLVPFMAIFYIATVITLLADHFSQIPSALVMVIRYAFEPLPAAAGTVAGLLVVTLRTGIQHALFSNEAGLGSAPMADAVSRTEFPVKQGLVSMLGPFLDTIVICTMTGLAIIIGLEKAGGDILAQAATASGKEPLIQAVDAIRAAGSGASFWAAVINHWGAVAGDVKNTLVSLVFSHHLGIWGQYAVAIALFFFSISTIFSWYFYSDRAMVFLGGGSHVAAYKWLYVVFVFIGGIAGEAHLIWNFSHLANGLMAFPNLIALLFLSEVVARETKNYFAQYPHRHDLAVRIYVILLSLLPKNTWSKVFGILAGLQLPRFIMIPVLLAFSRIYKINIKEAELELKNYRSLNNFFTRALKNGARVVAPGAEVIVSPVDGTLLKAGPIEKGMLLQSKGMQSPLEELLGTRTYLNRFIGGQYATIYLSPQDYHRIHMPVAGKIIGYYYKPGKLFPVNQIAVNTINRLFSRNERLITFIDTGKGLIAMIKVGATSVGRIRVTYDEKLATNNWFRTAREHTYQNPIAIEKGAEIGRFEMGSTVMLLFEKDSMEFLDLEEKQKLLFGQPIGLFKIHKTTK